MTKVPAEALKIGDKIMPPPREVQLWMRRRAQEKGLSESALHLTITGIDEATPDKRGRWILISADHAAEWLQGGNSYPFRFKARRGTPWLKVA